MNLTINCSSDRLQIWIGSDYHVVPNRGLEITLANIFSTRMREYDITDIYVINGPGSFTTLRVVCLTINTYISIHKTDKHIKLHNCTKTDLYNKLIPQSRGSQIAIYIGQRRNTWIYNLVDHTHALVPKTDLLSGIEDDGSLLRDDTSDEWNTQDRISLSVHQHQIIATWHDQIHTITFDSVMQSVEVLHPHYLMQPNIQSNPSNPSNI